MNIANKAKRQSTGSRAQGVNQIHDEDVLRWKLMVSEQDAVSLARQVGLGTAVLPAAQYAPTVSPANCHTAVEYVNCLPEDARRSLFKHCEQVSRHERLLVEGQERLRYVQAQVREMKQVLPPPPPAPPVKGPPVSVVPIRNPSCWASCCGVVELPAPPAPPPVPPMTLHLPPPAVLEAAVTAAAAARRQAASQGGSLQKAQLAIVAAPQPVAAEATDLQPVTASVGGASDVASATPHASRSAIVTASSGPTSAVHAAELPGQLDREVQPLPTLGPARAGHAPAPSTPALAPLPIASALLGRAPSPQSLLRPLAPLPPVAPRAAGPQGRGALPALPLAQFGSEVLATAAGQEPPPAQSLGAPDLSRYQDAEALRRITQIQAAQRGRLARKEAASRRLAQDAPPQHAPEAPQPHPQPGGARPAGPAASGAVDLGRYEDTASLQRITRIQAAQRGRLARQQVAALRAAGGAAGQQQPHPHSQPADAQPAALNVGHAAPDDRGSGHAPPHALQAGPEAQEAQQAAGGRPGFDLGRYQSPEALQQVTRIQAAQRGRLARQRAAELRAGGQGG